MSGLAVAVEGYGLHSLLQAKEPTFNTVVSGTLVSVPRASASDARATAVA
jgi:hypothetical protein